LAPQGKDVIFRYKKERMESVKRKRGRPRKNPITVGPKVKKKRGRPKKKSHLKQGDTVMCLDHPGTWNLVYYLDGDSTCAISNGKERRIVCSDRVNPINVEF